MKNVTVWTGMDLSKPGWNYPFYLALYFYLITAIFKNTWKMDANYVFLFIPLYLASCCFQAPCLPPFQAVRFLKFTLTFVCIFFVNSKIITFLFLQLGCQKIAFCLCGREPTSWPLCHSCSLPSGAHWCLMCWEPYGHFSLLFLLLLPWKLQVQKNQLLTPRTNRDFVHERDGDGDRPLTVPQLPLKTFSSQLPLVVRFSVICICSSLLFFFFLNTFFCTSLIA